MRHAPLRASWLLVTLLVAARVHPAAAVSHAVAQLNSSQTVEYEQGAAESWRWFSLPTGGTAAAVAGLVTQRGYGHNFPKMGFVMLSSSSGVPPGSLSLAEYDPTTYVHDDPIGARRQVLWDSPVDGIRSETDWKVLTLGIDGNHTDDEPAAVQTPLDVVLIGVRCNENLWTGSIPGCRYSLTATLLPFALADNVTVAAPMGRGDTHVYRIAVGEYDSLEFAIQRDVHNATNSPARGLVGAAMLGRERWSRPAPLGFPYNLSRAPADTELDISPDETQAMLAYQYQQLRADKGLLNIRGCARPAAARPAAARPAAARPTTRPPHHPTRRRPTHRPSGAPKASPAAASRLCRSRTALPTTRRPRSRRSSTRTYTGAPCRSKARTRRCTRACSRRRCAASASAPGTTGRTSSRCTPTPPCLATAGSLRCCRRRWNPAVWALP